MERSVSNMNCWKKLQEMFKLYLEQTEDCNELRRREMNVQWVKSMLSEWYHEGGNDHIILCAGYYLFGQNEKKSSVGHGKHTKED